MVVSARIATQHVDALGQQAPLCFLPLRRGISVGSIDGSFPFTCTATAGQRLGSGSDGSRQDEAVGCGGGVGDWERQIAEGEKEAVRQARHLERPGSPRRSPPLPLGP